MIGILMRNNIQFLFLYFKGLDFPVIDPCVDFYLFHVYFFNKNCTVEFRNTGMAPLTGNAMYTLVRSKYF